MTRHVRLLFIALACAMLPATVTTTMAQSGRPAPPADFQPATAPPAGVAVHKEFVTLPAAACANMNTTLVAEGKPAVASCQMVHTYWSINHAPLPSGTTLVGSRFSDHIALASVPPGYWYWAYRANWCSIYGCWYLGFYLNVDGIANGTNVWEWNKGCTPGGINSAIDWCGFLYNGGGSPYYAMQFGLNGHQCIVANQGTLCYNHGIRMWVNDSGSAYGYSAW
jgi:hypothetical protein